MNPSTTYKLRTPTSPHAIYFTVVRCAGAVTGLFVNSKEMGSHEWVTALMTSYVRQINQGRSIQEVITDMKETFDPKGDYHVPKLGKVHGFIHHLGLLLEREVA